MRLPAGGSEPDSDLTSESVGGEKGVLLVVPAGVVELSAPRAAADESQQPTRARPPPTLPLALCTSRSIPASSSSRRSLGPPRSLAGRSAGRSTLPKASSAAAYPPSSMSMLRALSPAAWDSSLGWWRAGVGAVLSVSSMLPAAEVEEV